MPMIPRWICCPFLPWEGKKAASGSLRQRLLGFQRRISWDTTSFCIIGRRESSGDRRKNSFLPPGWTICSALSALWRASFGAEGRSRSACAACWITKRWEAPPGRALALPSCTTPCSASPGPWAGIMRITSRPLPKAFWFPQTTPMQCIPITRS